MLIKYLHAFHRFLPLWVGARGLEFDWRYIQMSLDSNITMVTTISITNTFSMTHV